MMMDGFFCKILNYYDISAHNPYISHYTKNPQILQTFSKHNKKSQNKQKNPPQNPIASQYSQHAATCLK